MTVSEVTPEKLLIAKEYAAMLHSKRMWITNSTLFGLADILNLLIKDHEEAEARVRAKVVEDLRNSAFMVCDVNKEDILLCIKHGTVLIEARKLEHAQQAALAEPKRDSPITP